MKDKITKTLQNRLPFAAAMAGFLCGILTMALMGADAFGQTTPILSAFSTDSPFVSLIADYAGEIKLYLGAVLLSLLVRHIAPALFFVFLRSFYCALSSAFLMATGAPFVFFCCYLLLHLAVLVAFVSTAACLQPYIANRQEAFRQAAFPFLFYAGVIFLLAVIRNLLYLLVTLS